MGSGCVTFRIACVLIDFFAYEGGYRLTWDVCGMTSGATLARGTEFADAVDE